MKEKKYWVLLCSSFSIYKTFSALLLSTVVLLSGCSTVKVVDSGSRGLFQPSAKAKNSGLADSLLPSTEYLFTWPVKQGSISSYFGKRRKDFHDGIDIKALRGTPVYAARAGKVIYSGRRIKGYGNMIVIKHDDQMASVYAHNQKNTVKKNQLVTQGQMIGYVGATGKATGAHLHFEIRKLEYPEDPLLYLPPTQTVSALSTSSVSQ